MEARKIDEIGRVVSVGDGIELSLLEALSVAIKAATARLLDGLVYESPASSGHVPETSATPCLPCGRNGGQGKNDFI